MQWTVHFFLHKGNYWTQALSTEGQELSPGAAAYANRKVCMWCDLAHYADQSFKNFNINYQSILWSLIYQSIFFHFHNYNGSQFHQSFQTF